MEQKLEEYRGHRLELRQSEADELRKRKDENAGDSELLIDSQSVPYFQLPDKSYALYEYAYDWTTDLMDLARRFIDYQNTTAMRRERQLRGEQ